MTDTRRRAFLAKGALGGLALAGCPSMPRRDRRFDELGDQCVEPRAPAGAPSADELVFDYVVVGSGAGGGPVAARLALAGYHVGVIEAGGTDGGPRYDVPVFHPQASEDPATAWNYYVAHYGDPERARRDPKLVSERGGVLYPRAGTLGGCTAHHALVTVFPHASDWDRLAAALGDPSFGADAMHAYSKRLERCTYLDRDARERAGHGGDGWLPTTMTPALFAFRDLALVRMIAAAFKAFYGESRYLAPLLRFLWRERRDPNDWRKLTDRGEGVFGVPTSTAEGFRAGTREYLTAVAAACDTLTLLTGTLAERVELDRGRAVGVHCRRGARLYRADPHPSEVAGSPLYVRARREVILAAGAFNTPQLLMLSGIGPRDELERHGIPVVVDRPGVGRNLQDRYEISVVSRMNGELALVRDCTFAAPAEGEAADPCYAEWRRRGSGVYGTNGIACAVVRRSREDLPAPDLFIFGAPGLFRGYYHGYAGALTQAKNCFSWAVLKGQTRNTSGRVTLASPDPRDPPRVDFNYFDPADPSSRDDLDAVVAGVAFARRIFERSDVAADAELLPGPGVQGRDAIARYVEDQAWGHHASCTCPMGRADDPRAVLDADFRVRGVTGLRVVDASVFPRIPGFFIVSAIYMIAEKASDRILASADADVAPPRR